MSNPEIPQENPAEAVPVTPEAAPELVEAANVDTLPSIEDQFKALLSSFDGFRRSASLRPE